MTGPGRAPAFDPLDPEVVEDPYPTYERLREHGGLARGGPGRWVASRYEHVASLLEDPRLGAELPAAYHDYALGAGAASRWFSRILLYRDAPEHTHLRAALAAAFSRERLTRIGPRVRAIVDDTFDRAGDQAEIVESIALPIPIAVICELLGVPAADWDALRPHARALGRAFGARIGDEDRAAADAAVEWMRAYLGELLEDRRRLPADDALSVLAAPSSTVAPDAIVDNVVFLFFAGFETTTHSIANACAALAAHPSQLARLRSDAARAGSAVEELLRFDPPIQGVLRIVRAPIEIGDRALRPGRILVLLIGAANRDPSAFTRPNQLDLGRRPNRHLSFGGGAHGCLGAALTRLEMRAMLATVASRFEALEVLPGTARDHGTRLRAFEQLFVRLHGVQRARVGP